MVENQIRALLNNLEQCTDELILFIQQDPNEMDFDHLDQLMLDRENYLLEMKERCDWSRTDALFMNQVKQVQIKEKVLLDAMKSIFHDAKSNYAQSKNRNKLMNRYEESAGMQGYFMDKEY